jgi:IS30 family transposase
VPHLSQSERDEIYILKNKGYSLRDIGKAVNRAASTISDEISLNQTNGVYDPKKADHKAYVRRKYSKYQGMKIVANSKLQKFVDEKLYDDQSPKNLAGRITNHEKHLPSVSKNSIYRYIKSVYGRNIENHRNARKKRRRGGRRVLAEKLKDRVFIDERPISIAKRTRIGDAEADFIVSGKSGKGILLVVADRKCRAPFLETIPDVSIENVEFAFLRIKQRFPELRTITTDNDILFQKFKALEKLLDVKIYFCHPYHSWEKGTVENINGHIRKDIPKSSDISKYAPEFIQSIEDKLQRKIMAVLNYQTPREVLTKSRKQKKRRSAKRKFESFKK